MTIQVSWERMIYRSVVTIVSTEIAGWLHLELCKQSDLDCLEPDSGGTTVLQNAVTIGQMIQRLSRNICTSNAQVTCTTAYHCNKRAQLLRCYETGNYVVIDTGTQILCAFVIGQLIGKTRKDGQTTCSFIICTG
jgi:hypothetical protein